MRPSPEAVALAKAIPDTNDAIWKWSLKMDGSVSLESDPTPVHAAIRILSAECDALEKERDALLEALKRIANTIDCPSASPVGEYQYGLHCGVEDRDCCDRYEGADYGYSVGFECALEWATNEASAAIAAAKGAQQ